VPAIDPAAPAGQRALPWKGGRPRFCVSHVRHRHQPGPVSERDSR
jgi:hypothetical protein